MELSRLPDLLNGIFEFVGGITLFLNCYQLYKDKEVKGVMWQLTIFYTAWGFWNLYYYPHLGQWLSFIGGLFIVTGNAVWVGQVVWYLYLRPRYLHTKSP